MQIPAPILQYFSFYQIINKSREGPKAFEEQIGGRKKDFLSTKQQLLYRAITCV